MYYLTTLSTPPTARGWLVISLVTVWGLRLSIHIGIRNAGSGEDFRYRKWRDEAGSDFWWVSYFKVFLMQAIVLWVVSSPVMLAQGGGAPGGWSVLDLVALTMWMVGFLFEVVSDWQLARFKKDPANVGQVMRSGLWSLSRHPNYFGEALLWWGIGMLAFPTGGWHSFIGPLMITFLLIKVSGVAMLDAALEERRAGYADYIRSTPAFLPLGSAQRWWQRRSTSAN
jgi:steroid 5-alpha reductase family enzyme